MSKDRERIVLGLAPRNPAPREPERLAKSKTGVE